MEESPVSQFDCAYVAKEIFSDELCEDRAMVDGDTCLRTQDDQAISDSCILDSGASSHILVASLRSAMSSCSIAVFAFLGFGFAFAMFACEFSC